MNSQFMQRAIEEARRGMEADKGGPFGAVIVKGDEIISTGSNHVTSALDPSAHAEIVAIREACQKTNNFSLEGCTIYTSCEPCPMCLGAIYWARIDKIYFAATRKDAAAINFDDQLFYEELAKAPEKRNVPMVQMMHQEARKVFDQWQKKTNKTHY